MDLHGHSTDIGADKMEELVEAFNTIDLNGNGYLEEGEVQNALEKVGFKYAPYQVRDLIEKHDVQKRDGRIDFKEFKRLYAELTKLKYGEWQTQAAGNVANYSGIGDSKHSIRIDAEQIAFADWINRNLMGDAHCKAYLPLSPDGHDLYAKCNDGILLCKVINVSAPGTIDERALNLNTNHVIKKHENLVLAVNSARAIGCNVVNIGAEDIEKGTMHLILGLLWQIIKVGLLSEINLASHAELAGLLMDGETLDDLRKLSPVELLIRWVNYHLKNAGSDRRITNFQNDIKDSEVYAHLLQQISPETKKKGMHPVQKILSTSDKVERAELVLQNASRLDARVFVTPNDIVSGNAKLNMAFVANLFNHYPGMEKPAEPVEIEEETREEKTFRNWMNSIGVDPYVNYLYSDLCDGLIIFQLFDIIHPKIVDWKRVNTKFNKLKKNFEILENCNYAVELGKQCRFSLVGIGGEDLRDGNRTLTLALVWQLMRAYTLAVLTKLASDGKPIEDKAILSWAQGKLTATGKKTHIGSFQDSSLRDGLAIIDLVDAVSPGCINYDLVRRSTKPEDWLANAQYAISIARKIGATVYALPEDIPEVKSKMILTIVACLMVLDHHRTAGSVGAPRSNPIGLH